MENQICYVEIPCRDIARSKKFYNGVFGWSFEDSGENYSMFRTGDGLGGGLDRRTEEFPTQRGVTLYIQVQDIPKFLKQVDEAGGRTVKGKTEISKEFGYYALFVDTEGNTMGLWSEA
jgi:predicted enzyme related to lactoylglutathione lyase